MPSAGNARPGGRPRVLALVVAALPALVLTLGVTDVARTPATGLDGYWLATVGRAMATPWSAPTTNALSYTSPSTPWVMHEWLWAWPFARGLAARGPAFFAVIAMAVLFATGALLWWVASSRARDVTVASLLTALAVAALPPIARPTYLALFWAVAAATLAFRVRFRVAHLVAAVVIELVWANSHGSFPLGVFFLVAGAIDAHRRAGRASEEPADRRRDLRLRWLAVLFAAAVTCVNPYGLRLHALVLDYVMGASAAIQVVHDNVQEFFPIWRDVHVMTTTRWFLLSISLALALAPFTLRDARRRHAGRLTVMVVLLAMAIWQVRHMHFALVLVPALAVPLLEALLDALARRSAARRHDASGAAGPSPRLSLPWRARLRVVLVGLSVAALAGVVVHLAAQRGRSADDWVSARVGGADLPALVARLPDHASVFASFELSSRVLWLGAERGVRVFYDPRNDCYPADVLRSGLALDRGAALDVESAERVLDDAHTTHVLVARESELARVLDRGVRYRRAAASGHLVLFEASTAAF